MDIILRYVYDAIFKNNKINITNTKNDIYNNICDMKSIRKDEMNYIKKNMSHNSIVCIIDILSRVNDSLIETLNNKYEF
jgi:hypothetical protein